MKMKMNKAQKEYTMIRILRIRDAKKIRGDCKAPDPSHHIRRAITDGTARLKPIKELIAHFGGQIVEGVCYRSNADVTDIFAVPSSYKKALAEFTAKQKKHEETNQEMRRFAQGLIDRVELDEFETGQEAIRIMEEYGHKQK